MASKLRLEANTGALVVVHHPPRLAMRLAMRLARRVDADAAMLEPRFRCRVYHINDNIMVPCACAWALCHRLLAVLSYLLVRPPAFATGGLVS
jgi:hypothetical protein